MLTPFSRSKFVTKVLTSHSGEQFKVVFFVTLIDGKLKADIVSIEPISSSIKNTQNIFLPIFNKEKSVTFSYTKASHSVVSPFNNLFFFNSQPTRAPAF
ncbi:MAG TPA: hypothetical protein VJC02_00245 [Candidatus Paceibacterota bacterium]